MPSVRPRAVTSTPRAHRIDEAAIATVEVKAAIASREDERIDLQTLLEAPLAYRCFPVLQPAIVRASPLLRQTTDIVRTRMLPKISAA
jgi:hypothetical protein